MSGERNGNKPLKEGGKTIRALVRFFDVGALVSFAAMMGCVSLEVVCRNLLKLPTPWAEEASRFFCVWTVFLGSATAWFRNSHIVINVLPRLLSRRYKWVLQIVNGALTAIFLICVWFGTLFIIQIQYPAKTTALEISISYFYLGLLVGTTGMVVFHFRSLIRIFLRIDQP